MFIQRASAAIFACRFMRTLFTCAATANRTLIAFIYMPLKIYLKITPSVFVKDISCWNCSKLLYGIGKRWTSTCSDHNAGCAERGLNLITCADCEHQDQTAQNMYFYLLHVFDIYIYIYILTVIDCLVDRLNDVLCRFQ